MGDWRRHFRAPFGGWAHPGAPAGGVGPGFSRVPGHHPHWESSKVPHPDSPAGRSFDWSALARIDIDDRVGAVIDAIAGAQKYAPSAIANATGIEFGELLDGVLPGLLMCLCVVASTTALGAAAGAAIGALALGIGAGPGAGFGATAGFEAGVALLEGLGLAFLVGVIGKSVAEAGKLAKQAVHEAWHSVDEPRSRRFHVDHAGRTLAAAAAALMRGVLQAIVAFLVAKGANATASRVPELLTKLRASKLGDGFAAWVERNWASLIKNERLQQEQPSVQGGRGGGSGGSTAKTSGSTPSQSFPKPTSRRSEKTTAKESSRDEAPPAKRLALTGVTDAEFDLAAAEGSSPAQMAARRKVATQFYSQYAKLSPERSASEVAAINTTQPVRVGPPPSCPSPQAQWQTPGKAQGQYYADEGVKPTNLGIHDEGDLGPGTPVKPKQAKLYDVPSDAPYLESTAAPADDSWSVSGQTHPTQGGATQRYVPRASSAVTPADAPSGTDTTSASTSTKSTQEL